MSRRQFFTVPNDVKKSLLFVKQNNIRIGPGPSIVVSYTVVLQCIECRPIPSCGHLGTFQCL